MKKTPRRKALLCKYYAHGNSDRKGRTSKSFTKPNGKNIHIGLLNFFKKSLSPESISWPFFLIMILINIFNPNHNFVFNICFG